MSPYEQGTDGLAADLGPHVGAGALDLDRLDLQLDRLNLADLSFAVRFRPSEGLLEEPLGEPAAERGVAAGGSRKVTVNVGHPPRSM